MDCACLEWTKVCEMNLAKYMQEIRDNLYLGDRMSPEAEMVAAVLAQQAPAQQAPAQEPPAQEPAPAAQEPVQQAEPVLLCFCGKPADGDYCSMQCEAQAKGEEEEYYDAQDAFYAQRRALHLQTCTADCIVGICTCPGAAQLAWTATADLGVTTGAPWAADAAAGLANLVLQNLPPVRVTTGIFSPVYESEELVNDNPFSSRAEDYLDPETQEEISRCPGAPLDAPLNVVSYEEQAREHFLAGYKKGAAEPEPQTPPIKGKESQCFLCREEFFGTGKVCPDCAKTEISIECRGCYHEFLVSPAYTGERLCTNCRDCGRRAELFCLACEECPRKECIECYMAANQYDGDRLRMPDTLWQMRQTYYMEEQYYSRK